MISGFGVSALCALGALLALCGVIAMALPGRPEPWAKHLLQRVAWATAAAAAAVYAQGFFAVMSSDLEFDDGVRPVPAPERRTGFDAETVRGLSHHRTSYLPLRFDCVRADGTSYPSSSAYVWMNWTTGALVVACALSAAGAGSVTRLRARQDAR